MELEKNKRGAPALPYTDEIAEEIIDRLSAGESLRSITKDPRMPCREVIARWVTSDTKDFARRYAHARDMGLDAMVERALEVAETPVKAHQVKKVHKPQPGGELSDGEEFDPLGGVEIEVVTKDAVERSRLIVDTIKWYASKLANKRYGDKIEVDHKGNVGVEARLLAGRKRVSGGQ